LHCSTNQLGLGGFVDNAVPVLLVDGYNVCGYWIKLKKHFLNGKLELARQKLIDELITFSMLREVKVVVVFDAMMSGFPNHKEYSAGFVLPITIILIKFFQFLSSSSKLYFPHFTASTLFSQVKHLLILGLKKRLDII